MSFKKPVETLHVLVHPHFSVSYSGGSTPFSRPFGEEVPVDMRQSARKLLETRRDLFTEEVKLAEVMHRFYRHEIQRIAKTNEAHLVILKTAHYTQRGRPRDVMDYVRGYEQRLITFARRKLGKRLVVLSVEPEGIGEQIKRYLSDDVPVKLFGEYLNTCVSRAASSLTRAGFTQVNIDRSKSVD